MVRRDGPTTSTTARQHERQLPLLLDLSHNQSCEQMDMEMCSLLLGWSRPSWQLVKASSASSMRIFRKHTSILVDGVKNDMLLQHPLIWLQSQYNDAIGLPSCSTGGRAAYARAQRASFGVLLVARLLVCDENGATSCAAAELLCSPSGARAAHAPQLACTRTPA